MTYDDPGWRRALVILVPGGGILMALRRTRDGITNARILFLSFLSSALYLGIVVLFIVDGPPKEGAWPALVVGAMGLGGAAGIRWIRRQPLIGTDPRSVAGGFMSAMIIGVALAETPTLLGFVFSVVQQARWPYALGLVFTLPGMALVAPTRAEIERRQQQMRERGSSVNLGQSLFAARRSRS